MRKPHRRSRSRSRVALEPEQAKAVRSSSQSPRARLGNAGGDFHHYKLYRTTRAQSGAEVVATEEPGTGELGGSYLIPAPARHRFRQLPCVLRILSIRAGARIIDYGDTAAKAVHGG
jgi:hypothetical protein